MREGIQAAGFQRMCLYPLCSRLEQHPVMATQDFTVSHCVQFPYFRKRLDVAIHEPVILILGSWLGVPRNLIQLLCSKCIFNQGWGNISNFTVPLVRPEASVSSWWLYMCWHD